jgi:hypothetical protein
MSTIKTQTDLVNKLMDYIKATANKNENEKKAIYDEINNFLKLNLSYTNAKLQNLQKMATDNLKEIYSKKIPSEQDLINIIRDSKIAKKNNNITKLNDLLKDINVYLYFYPSYKLKIADLDKKAEELSTAGIIAKSEALSKETIVKMKSKILINNFNSIIEPNLLNANNNKNSELEKLLKNSISNESIENDAKDNAIIFMLRQMKKPNDNEQQKLNRYNQVILPILAKLEKHISDTFGSYYSSSKKDELIAKRDDINVPVLEYYEDVVMPKSHIGVM